MENVMQIVPLAFFILDVWNVESVIFSSVFHMSAEKIIWFLCSPISVYGTRECVVSVTVWSFFVHVLFCCLNICLLTWRCWDWMF